MAVSQTPQTPQTPDPPGLPRSAKTPEAPGNPQPPKTPETPTETGTAKLERTVQISRTTISPAEEVRFRPDTKFQIPLGVRSAEIDDETVAIDPLRNTYFRLNSTGTLLWQLAGNGNSFSAIRDDLSERFGLDPERAGEVTTEFLNELFTLLNPFVHVVLKKADG